MSDSDFSYEEEEELETATTSSSSSSSEREIEGPAYGIYIFNMLLEMIKNRYFDGYDETLNYKDKAIWAAEQQRERDFYATYSKFVIFANLYVPLFRICEYGRATPFQRTRLRSLTKYNKRSKNYVLRLHHWINEQQNELELVDIVNESITGIEITKKSPSEFPRFRTVRHYRAHLRRLVSRK
jgi:hypothetical protein